MIYKSHCQHEAGAQSLCDCIFVVDVQNQQNHIAHEALFQRTVKVNVTMELIKVVKRGHRSVWHRMGQSTEKMNLWPYLPLLNFKRVVGCQVFWPLK